MKLWDTLGIKRTEGAEVIPWWLPAAVILAAGVCYLVISSIFSLPRGNWLLLVVLVSSAMSVPAASLCHHKWRH